MRWGIKILIGGGLYAAIVAGVAAAAALLLIADINAFRTEIAAAIEAETGRKVEFGGDIRLSLGRTTALTVNDVRLANAAGGGGPDMLHIEKASAEVAILPLWYGDIVVRRLVLHGTDILVDIDRHGRTNFDFAAAGRAGAVTAPADGEEFSLRQIGDVDIRDARITIRDARDGSSQQLALRRLRLRDDGGEQMMRVAIAGNLDAGDEPLSFDLEGEIGHIAALVAGDKAYPVDLKGRVDGMEVVAAGTIADPLAVSGLALAIELSGDDLTAFEPILGSGLPPVGPVHFTARLAGEPEEFTLKELTLSLGDSRARGDLSVDLAGARTRLGGKLAATRLDLVPWLTHDDGVTENRPERLLDNGFIDFTVLQEFDGRLAVTADTVSAATDVILHDATLSFDLRDGRLRADSLKARLDGRAFAGAVRVDSRAEPPRVSLRLSGRDIDVGRILARFFDEPFLYGTGGIDLAIDGQGRSVAEIIGASTGHARVLMDAGEVKTGDLGLLVGGVSELLPGLGNGGGDWTAINCLAADFDLRGGIAESRVSLLDSEVVRLTGEGEVNLSNDTIDYAVLPSAKVPTLNVAVPVNLSGPLTDPAITPDELSVMARIGGLVGSVIFPPAALLSLGTLGSGDNPCLEAVRSAEGPAQTPDWTHHDPELDTPPEVEGNSDRLIDAVRRLLPLRGG